MVENPHFMGYTDNELIEMQKRFENDAREYERQAAQCRGRKGIIQEQLNIRSLNRFWQAHPGLRLNVMDKVIVTAEFVAIDNQYQVGEELLVKELGETIELGEYYGDILGHVGFVSIDLARQMRETYLASLPEGEAQ
jgi:hypothetical protein